MALGAAILLAVGVTFPGLWHVRRTTTGTAANRELAAREITTRRAQRAEVRLSDGTRVILGPDSRLRIPAAAEYDVELEGEALFDVVHDTARTFRVHTSLGVAEDIGTKFVVSAYPEARDMSVAMVAGQVALSKTVLPAGASRVLDAGAKSALVLGRGDFGRIDAMGRLDVQHDVDLSRYIGWTNGRLVLDGLTLAEATSRINRWFNLDVQIDNSALSQERLAGAFDLDDTASDVLRRLALSLHARVERHGRVVRFVRQ